MKIAPILFRICAKHNLSIPKKPLLAQIPTRMGAIYTARRYGADSGWSQGARASNGQIYRQGATEAAV